MAIQETRKKIHFTPFEIKKGRTTDDSDAPTITIIRGNLRFGAGIIRELNLNGKFVNFAYDPLKNIIGFRVQEEVNLRIVGKTWKMVRQNPKSGQWTVSVRKMLEMIDQKMMNKAFYRLPVQKYVEANGMDRGQIYYFVELIDGESPQGSETPSESEITQPLTEVTA